MQINRRGHTYIYKYICTHTHTHARTIHINTQSKCHTNHHATNPLHTTPPTTVFAKPTTHLPFRPQHTHASKRSSPSAAAKTGLLGGWQTRGQVNTPHATPPSKHDTQIAITQKSRQTRTRRARRPARKQPSHDSLAWLARMTPARTFRDIKEPSRLIVWWFGIYLLIYFVALFPNQQLMTISNMRVKISSGIKEWSTRV